MIQDDAPLTLLPEPRLQWSSFAASYGLQALALVSLVGFYVLCPQKLLAPPAAVFQNMPLIATPSPRWAEQRPKLPPVPPPVKVSPVEAPKLVAEVIKRPPVVPVHPQEAAPRPVIPHPALASIVTPAPARSMPQIVRTGVFSTGSQAAATVNRPAQAVQTGGFGDSRGIKGEGKAGARLMAANVGSFDAPAGSGNGNGTGGAHGARGMVASAGFGNSMAVGNSNHTARSVQQAGFGDVHAIAEAPRTARPAASPATTPIQILSKPSPVYTEEARRLRLEGEVLLAVAFPVTGECRVLQVVRGLGHGLDEAAIRAAQQIRFRPATRGGQAMDSTATIHVVFQLAY